MIQADANPATPPDRWDGFRTVLHKETLVFNRQMKARWRVALRVFFLFVYLGWMVLAAFMPILTDHSNVDVPYGLFGYLGANWVLIGLLLALVLPFTAGAIAREREVGSLEMLLLTRLTSREILLGKLLTPLLPYLKVMGITLVAVALAIALQKENPLSVISAPLAFLLFACLAGVVGLCCSTIYKNTGRALGVALVTLYVLSNVVISLFAIIFGGVAWLTFALTQAHARRLGRPLSQPGIVFPIALGIFACMGVMAVGWLLIQSHLGSGMSDTLQLLMLNPTMLLLQGDMFEGGLPLHFVIILSFIIYLLRSTLLILLVFAHANWRLEQLRRSY